MKKELKGFYRPNEAGIYLGISKSSVFNLVKEGKLKSHKISKQVTVISKDDLDNLVLGGAI